MTQRFERLRFSVCVAADPMAPPLYEQHRDHAKKGHRPYGVKIGIVCSKQPLEHVRTPCTPFVIERPFYSKSASEAGIVRRLPYEVLRNVPDCRLLRLA